PDSRRRPRSPKGSRASSRGIASITAAPIRLSEHDRIRAPPTGFRPMILVTGGAGFIGANFILDWFATVAEPVVNLDKLTYAGNTGNLAELRHDPRHVFVRGDIGERGLVRDRLAR